MLVVHLHLCRQKHAHKTKTHKLYKMLGMHVRSSLVNGCERQVAAVVRSAPVSHDEEAAGVFQMVCW